MHKLLYGLSIFALAALPIYLNLQSPPYPAYIVGVGLVLSSAGLAATGRLLQLVLDIRERLPEG